MRIKSQKPKAKKIEIDLLEPEGNAFYLLGLASNLLKQLGHQKDYIDNVLSEMKKSDYGNLLSVMDKELGDYIIFYNDTLYSNDK